MSEEYQKIQISRLKVLDVPWPVSNHNLHNIDVMNVEGKGIKVQESLQNIQNTLLQPLVKPRHRNVTLFLY